MTTDQIKRHLGPRVTSALDSFRIVVLHGARQSGKTTLARLIAEERSGTYVTFDDDAAREAAAMDPRAFLTSYALPLVIDEIQLGGDRVIRMIKQLVDEDPTPGQFLLTGSTNFLTVPTISESLAGRARILRLWPLSEAEVVGEAPQVQGWFDTVPNHTSTVSRDQYLELISRGGYPELIRLEPDVRHDWIESYVETVTQRDIVALADIRNASALPRLLRWAAANTSGQINIASAARDLSVNAATVTSYLQWLETVFLLHQVPAWSRNLSSRAARRPKFHLTDSGIATDLLGMSPETLRIPTSVATGPLIETFTVNEIAKQLASSSTPATLSHYRDNNHREVDLVLEHRDGATIAIEIKATTSPTGSHLNHVRWLRDKLDEVTPGMFKAGILLHCGTQSLTIDDRLHFIPISSLWTSAPS